MLENEKYRGSVKLLDSVNKEKYYLLKNNHEAIIAEEVFNKVQEEKSSRSNLDEDNIRKSRKYSSKKLGIMHRQQNKIVDIDEVRL